MITEEAADTDPLSEYYIKLGDEAIICDISNPPYDWMVDVYRNGEVMVEGIGVKESEISPVSCGQHEAKFIYSQSRDEFFCPFCTDLSQRDAYYSNSKQKDDETPSP